KLVLGWRALVAAGQVAPLGPAAAEAARQVLRGAAMAAASGTAAAHAAEAAVDEEALRAAAQGVLSCCSAGLAVPPALLQPLERGSCEEGVLAALGPAAGLALARAFVAAGYQPQSDWVDAWEAAVVSSMRRTSPAQLTTMAAVLHSLALRGGAGVQAARPDFVAAAAQRLLATGIPAAVGSATCGLALHLGELAGGGGPCVALPAGVMEVAAELLAAATSALPSLDTPDLAALLSGLALSEVRAPAEVWSALLSRATDAPAAAAAATAAARRALEVGLPWGIKPGALEHFLSVAGQHVPGLPAASVVGLLGLVAAAGKGKVRQALLAAALTRVYDKAATLGPRDAALLFSVMDALAVNLTEPLAAKVKTVASGGASESKEGVEALTPVAVLRRVAEVALVPERVLADLGLEATAKLVEVAARLRQSADAAAAETQGPTSSAAADGPADVVPRQQLLSLLQLLQPSLAAATPQALAALSGGAAAMGLSMPPAWLAALLAANLAALPTLDPLTSARIATAATRCEQLARLAPGSGGGSGSSGSWIEAFVRDMERKLAAAPPTALALTLQVLVAHGYRPSAEWTSAFLAATAPFLGAPLPLTQAQAAGAAAVAASLAAGRTRSNAAAKSPAKAATSQKPSGANAAAAVQQSSQSSTSASTAAAGAPAAAATFTPAQLSQLVGGLTALQLQQYVTPGWLAMAVRQVEGRALQASYRDLAEALYGIKQLGGVVREAAANQLVIVSQAKLAATPLPLLSRMLSVVAAAEGRKVSPKWWEEAQRVLTSQLKAASESLTAGASSSSASSSAVARLEEVSQAVTAVLRMRRNKAGADLSAQLAAALAAAVAVADGAVAAALPHDAAVQYVQACTEVPQLGLPPPVLLDRYLRHTGRLLESFAGAEDSRSPELSAAEASEASQAPADSAQLSKKGKDRAQSRRSRARAAKRGGGGGGSSALSTSQDALLQLLPSALAVGRMLVEFTEEQRPDTAVEWLGSLVSAAVDARAALPAPSAAALVWLMAKLDVPEEEVESAATQAKKLAIYQPLLEVLAARLEGTAEAAEAVGLLPPAVAAGGAGVQQVQQQLSPDQVLDAVWGLMKLGLVPGPRLRQEASLALSRRLTSLPHDVAMPILKALAWGCADEHLRTCDPTADFNIYLPDLPPNPADGPLAAELSRYLDANVLPVQDNDKALLEVLDVARQLGLRLAAPQVAAACGRLAAAAELGTLRGEKLFAGIMALRAQEAQPPAEQLDALSAAVVENIVSGGLGGLVEVVEATAALYDMGARPDEEWMEAVREAIVEDLNSPAHGTGEGGVPRRPLSARGLVRAFWQLTLRMDGSFMVLALAASKAVTEDLEGQLGITGEGDEETEAEAQGEEVAAQQEEQAAVEQEQEGVEGDEEDEEALQAERAAALARLDPRLLAPLGLPDVVLLLEGLAEAGQPAPESLFPLLEAMLAPALRQAAAQHPAGASHASSSAASSRSGSGSGPAVVAAGGAEAEAAAE
ncbi:hypothetical protein Agub_g1615, partial [Astrephomene gubernaculifera]